MNQIFHSFTTWYRPQDLLLVTPPSDWRFMYVYIGMTGAFALLGIILLFLKLHPALKSQISGFLWTQVATAIFLYFFRTQQIPYLGMDMLRVLQEFSIVAWIGYLVWYFFVPYKGELRADEAVIRKEKYLPKAKK